MNAGLTGDSLLFREERKVMKDENLDGIRNAFKLSDADFKTLIDQPQTVREYAIRNLLATSGESIENLLTMGVRVLEINVAKGKDNIIYQSNVLLTKTPLAKILKIVNTFLLEFSSEIIILIINDDTLNYDFKIVGRPVAIKEIDDLVNFHIDPRFLLKEIDSKRPVSHYGGVFV